MFCPPPPIHLFIEASLCLPLSLEQQTLEASFVVLTTVRSIGVNISYQMEKHALTTNVGIDVRLG